VTESAEHFIITIVGTEIDADTSGFVHEMRQLFREMLGRAVGIPSDLLP